MKMTFKIRDLNKKGKFNIDDLFMDKYAMFLGIHALGTYNCLCRHVDKNQKCFPSEKKIAYKLGITKSSVGKAIKKLVFWNIIFKKRIGNGCTNRYFLIDKSEWKTISEDNIKKFNEVCKINFKSLQDKLQKSTTHICIERKHKRKETQKKGYSLKKELTGYELLIEMKKQNKKPFYLDQEMRWSKNKWWAIPKNGGQWLEFDDLENNINWK